MEKLTTILFVLFSFTSCLAANDVNDDSGKDITADKIPSWIKTEKIRAGYTGAPEDVTNVGYMVQTGLNTVIANEGYFRPGAEFNIAMSHYKAWAMAAKKNNMHLFLSFYWQPQSMLSAYRRCVLADGTMAFFVCPLDANFWTNHMNRIGKAIANLSLEKDLIIDGILLDTELYGTEQGKAHERTYGPHACFCDSCFSKFLISKGYSGYQLPNAKASQRQDWLQKHDLLAAYYDYLKIQLNSLASKFREEIRLINPDLLLGMYPTLTLPVNLGGLGENWVNESIARAWGTRDFPMILFATDTYCAGVNNIIPEDVKNLYLRQNIHIVYCAGYLFESYTSDGIEKNIPIALEKADGYWLFSMPKLWNKKRAYELKKGTQAEYLQAILKANSSN